ncbi:hypothetical protein SAMN05216267_11005 [Actinacidiphila rubida]|uniref:Uncharacterized protein n=1 Tax=Actinacidiphila rubida TaxID=310780 RepID=A0A1H8V2T4_9ACTN|nr:hypothetical protein SAMN05216267_11005 [Actinacidiphila rubida]
MIGTVELRGQGPHIPARRDINRLATLSSASSPAQAQSLPPTSAAQSGQGEAPDPCTRAGASRAGAERRQLRVSVALSSAAFWS